MKRILTLAAIAIVVMPLMATAQSSRYDNRQQGSVEVEQLRKQLKEMIEEAERTRAADPRFLKDLRSLLRQRGSARPSRHPMLLEETFTDGDFTANPAWTVASGRFDVARQGGLLSDVSTYGYGRRSGSDRTLSNEEIAAYFLGTLLNRRLREGSSGTNDRYDRGPAEIYLPFKIPNAFRMQLDFGAKGDNGAFEFRVYQGSRRLRGYALAYSERTGLTLLKRHRGTDETVIKAIRPAKSLLDGVEHLIDWIRKRDGEMVVRIDKEEVLRVVDTSFRDPFNGIRMLNGGGKQVLFALRVRGPR